MASTNSYEKHYLANRRSTNDEKYVLILFKSDNTFIIKKKSNLHGVDENGLVNIKDRGKTYTGYCLFEGTRDEIEVAAERLDKEMNTDLESDCEGMTSHCRTERQQSRQHSVTPRTTTNLSNVNVETAESSTPKSNISQKRIDRVPQQQKIQSLASPNLQVTPTNYRTPPPTNVSVPKNQVRSSVEQSSHSTGGPLRSIDNVGKSAKANRTNERRILTFDDYFSEEANDDDDDDDDIESAEHVVDLDSLLPLGSATNNRNTTRPSKRSRSKASERPAVEKSNKRLCSNSLSLDGDGNQLLKKIFLSVDDLNKDVYQSSKDIKSLVVTVDKIDKKLNILYENQKKIQRALTKKKINVALNGDQFGDENIIVDDSPFKSKLIYVDFKGESIDLLQLYGVRTQMGRYVALVMDNTFTKEEITTISLDDLLKDERYLIIKEAVRSRFKLNHAMLMVEWPTLHECILQKRRNEIKKKRHDVGNTTAVIVQQTAPLGSSND